MSEKALFQGFLGTTQQDVLRFATHEITVDSALQHAFDRSCTAHCIEAIAELEGIHLSSLERLDDYVKFLRDNGADPEKGTNNPELYSVDDGWYNFAIGDLLRFNGWDVVSQNLKISPGKVDISIAQSKGRVRSDDERVILAELASFSSELPNKSWLDAISCTLSKGGYVLTSIVIPSSKKPDAVGRHSTFVRAIHNNSVVYFDPDKLTVDRYGDHASEQHIERRDDSRLFYAQPLDVFLKRMTGEVMHIFPPK